MIPCNASGFRAAGITLAMLLLFCVGLAPAAMGATITTDTTDYPRGATVYITGSGFASGEVVTLQVVHADGDPLGGEGHDPWDVQADGAGSISATWVVPYDDNLGEALLLTAVGQTSLAEAATVFTDNVGTNLDQLQNGTLTKDPEWANGNINTQNSCYSEGDGVPFRYFLTGVATGEKYRFTIQSEWTKGGINAYDYFVDYNITEATALAFVGDVCGTIATAVPSDCSPVLNSAGFPDPTNGGNYTGTLPPGFFPGGFVLDTPANLKSYGAVVDSMGPYFFTGTSSDLELNLYVYVTVTQTGSAGFFWAGHLAEGIPSAWGIGAGAASVSGAPYHMRAIDLKTIINNVASGSGAQNQDRSIQNGTICLPPDATISCSAQSLPCDDISSFCYADPGATSYDWVITGAVIDSGQGTETIYYTATSDTVRIYLTACATTGACPGDFCCNEDSAMVIVDFDTSPPIIQCPADIDLGCNPDSIPSCDPGAVLASDPCGTPGISCQQIGSDVQSGCAWTRTYRYYVTDAAGNVDSCDQLITWTVDTEKPVFTQCPANADLGCNPTVPDAAAGDATATDNCGTPTVSVQQGTPSNDGCVWTRTDVWTATDGCGNSETCSRTLTWTVDTEKPVFTQCPANADLGCNPTVPDAAAGDATATDNCGTPTVSVQQGQVTGGPCIFSRTDTWTATDGCGNSETCQRTLTWKVDTTPPELTGCPANASYTCLTDVPPQATVTANDACDGAVSVTPSETQTNPGSSCNNTITRTWTATDDCGNSATCSQTIIVNDNVPPQYTYCPLDKTIDCDIPWDFDSPSVTDCDLFVTPVIVAVDTALGPMTGDTTFTAKWVATDACGNASDTCYQAVTQKACTTGQGCTFTMGGWGSKCPSSQQNDPNSTQPGCIRDHYFDEVFPDGVMIGLPGHSAKWTTAQAIEAFLPAGGGPRLLCAGDLVNPTSTCGATLGGQLLVLKLNVGFACAGVFADLGIADAGFCYGAGDIPLGCGGPFAGLTVNEFLALADAAIAGDLSVLEPYSATLSDLNMAASCMNELFDDCDPLAPTVGIAELQAAGVELGDCNDDGKHSSADLVIMVNYILRGASAPQPYAEVTDFNYDYKMNTADVIEMVLYIFKGGIPVK